MRRKPRILRCIYAAIVISILLWATYQEFFVPHPDNSLSSNSIIGPYIRKLPDGTYEARPFISYSVTGDIEAGRPIVTPISSDDENKKTETLKEDLEIIKLEIDQLQFHKKNLKEKILRLEKENDRLGKINFDLQKTIIEFVEKNRIRDILSGAFVGAIVSAILTFILGIPQIRKKIIDYFSQEKVE